MNRTCARLFGLVFLAGIAAVGCGPKPDIHEMMKLPPRPAELDQLNRMVGDWEFKMTVNLFDQSIEGSGTSHIEWDSGKWMLRERVEGKMEGHDETYHGNGAYMYHPGEKKFMMFWYGNDGRLAKMRMWRDKKNENVWHAKGSSVDTMEGHDGTSVATMKFVDDNSMEMEETIYDSWGLFKMGTVKITMKRK